jgi:hypothetical protein
MNGPMQPSPTLDAKRQLVLACHSRATEEGQARSVRDNYGHLRRPGELVVRIGPA